MNPKEPTMLESYSETRFAVARRNKIVSDGYATVDEAKQQHAHMSEAMEALSLNPDLHVVTVEVEHTVGKHQAYEEPTEDDHPAVEAEQGEQEQPPAEQSAQQA